MGNSLSLEDLFENIMFSFGPITSVVAAKYGHKTWLNWEIVNSIGLGVTLILKPDFYMPMLVRFNFGFLIIISSVLIYLNCLF